LNQPSFPAKNNEHHSEVLAASWINFRRVHEHHANSNSLDSEFPKKRKVVRVIRQYSLLLAILFGFFAAQTRGAEWEKHLQWGINSLTLKSPCGASPTAREILAGRQNASLLKTFHRAGGENAPTTPTECGLAYNAENLFVVFRCAENHLDFPAISHPADWHALLHSPSEQDAAFPDKVDFFISPDLNKSLFYQFAVTLDGQKFAARRHGGPEATSEDETKSSNDGNDITDFEATVTRNKNEWIAFLRIPWQTIGGKPALRFGLMPARTRWRDSEITSPVAFDFFERTPVDLFIETQFTGKTSNPAAECLCQLPSGSLRWQRPAVLTYPSAKTIAEIWRMQQSLPSPTTPDNLAKRIQLTQRWTDLLSLEGFNFRVSSGSIVPENMMPYMTRRQINAALRRGNMTEASRLLDAYLAQLDKVSRDWFADGSPGDIARSEWKSVTTCEKIEQRGTVVEIHCRAGLKPVNLHLTFPATGGIRLCGDAEGYFKPSGLLPVTMTKDDGLFSVETAGVRRVLIQKEPFQISLCDAKGKTAIIIQANDIAFRFDPAGKIVAVDFRNHLEPNETIFGFGERFNRFNENGNVLTLWGMDDWLGLTVGLRNESYKPVPVFHNSKGYTVFVNSSYRLRADIGKSDSSQIRLTQAGPIFDYYFWIESPLAALESYTALTGRPILPPKWAFGAWMGRTGRGWMNAPGHDPVAEQERVVKKFAELDIPHTALYAEGSGADSPQLYKFLEPRDIKVLSWAFCGIGEAEQFKLMGASDPGQIAVLKTGGDDIGYVDFTNPNALEVARRWWQRRLDLGLAGSMVDFGDRVPESAVFHNGERGAEMHNFYSYDYHRTYNEVFKEKRGEDFILFGRAASPGSQKWAAQFAGDQRANFTGLQSVLNGALNLSACGFSTWGSDLGGFLGWPEPAVYMRWTEFACFSPLMRSHGRTPREPWEYGEPAVANYKHYAWVRENLLDYLYDAATQAHDTGIPMMRSLPVAFPREPSLTAVSNEYLLGNDLLVAPVTSESDSRNIAFPEGKWTSLWNGRVIPGPANLNVSARLESIPVYLREGAMLPVKLNVNLELGASMTAGHVNALIVTPPGKDQETQASANKSTRAGMRPISNGLIMNIKQSSGVSVLIVYDAPLAMVKVDDVMLPKSTSQIINSPGWLVDASRNRAIVRLPAVRAGNGPATCEVELRFATQLANQ
jgi:alpha-glucosidase (family GH31 glycosyl hydrolase)